MSHFQRVKVFSLLALIFALPCFAAGKREVVIHGENFPNVVVILIDTSGSMGNDEKYKIAMRETWWVAGLMSDEAQLRVGSFDNHLGWHKDEFTKLPDKDFYTDLKLWLKTRNVSGSTDLVAAMGEVLKIRPDDPLGIVVVTDEQIDGGAEGAAEQIASINGKRKHPATIGVIGVFPEKSDEALAAKMSKTGGAYMRVVK